jgi:Toprim domain-containing protein
MTAMIPDGVIARARRTPIEDILERHGVRLRGRSERVGPCPVCGGTDRFGANTAKQLFTCRQCGSKGGAIDLEMFLTGSDFTAAVEALTGERAPKRDAGSFAKAEHNIDRDRDGDDVSRKIAAALHLWDASVDPRGTLAEQYVTGRGLELGDDLACDVLRWNPGCGAMIALFRDIVTDAPQAISRTFLDAEGRKLERKFLGPTKAAAIKLDADTEVLGGLHIGEGVETCMAARILGIKPAWALGSAGAIAAFPVLSGIECLTILEEHDDASKRAVEACARRWHAAGREVIANKPLGGKDLNDSLRRRA